MATAGEQALELYRQDIQAAIARAAEIRALHEALIPAGGRSSSATRLPEEGSPSHSSVSHQFSGGDYPVFAPRYEEEPVPAYHFLRSTSQGFLETSSTAGLERDVDNGEENLFDDKKEINLSSLSGEHQMFPTTDGQRLCPSSCANHAALQEPSPGWSRRSGTEGSEVVTACNKCKPAIISRVADFEHKSYRNNSVGSHASGAHQSSTQLHQNKKGAAFSWLFPGLRRKPKSKISPSKRSEPEDKPEVVVKDWGMCSVETLRKELNDATENRDAALAEVGEMRSSLQELKEKLVHLEAYCKELKNALRQATQGKHAQLMGQPNLTKRTKSVGSSRGCPMPVSHEVMLEGFLQIVSEARLSVKQFCKTLIGLTEEADIDLMERLNAHVQSNNLTVLSCGCSKGLQYHLESLVNQTLYQDFENCVFQTNGAQKILDPHQFCLENFSAFVALRSLSWKEVLKEGSLSYSEDLSRFCNQKMNSVVSLLDWSGPWPEQLCESFFVAAKCAWLLHLLAFSFSPPLVIFRVEENRAFDPLYMEAILLDRHRIQAPNHVKVMVMPGFYVHDRVVIRCKVLCNCTSVV